MATDSLITEDLRKLVGAQQGILIYKVEEGSVIRYAQAIGDPNPLFNDPEYAKNGKRGRIICPPGFFGWAMKNDEIPLLKILDKMVAAGAPSGVLDGGVDYKFFFPVGVGDVLTCSTTITSMVERDTKMGKTIVATIVADYINQNGDMVSRETRTAMLFRV